MGFKDVVSWPLGSDVVFGTKKKLEESPYTKKARTRLYSLGTEPGPEQPLRQIAPLSELQQIIQQMTQQWMGAGVPETRQIATEEATRTATQPVDITQMPEYKGMLAQILEEGQLEANRLRRGLQLGGMEGSTTGRDVLGRSVTGTQQRLASSLAPFAEAERQRRFAAIPMLEDITRGSEATTMQKIGTGAEVGEMGRMVEQQQMDALLEQALREISFNYGIQPNILLQMMSQSPALITGGERGILADLIALGARGAGGMGGA